MDLKDTEFYSMLLDENLALKDGDTVCAIPYLEEGYGIIYNEEIMDKYFAPPAQRQHPSMRSIILIH
ncbi:MAG: hypothetical protein V8R80_12245 [Eubacterium sp.]